MQQIQRFVQLIVVENSKLGKVNQQEGERLKGDLKNERNMRGTVSGVMRSFRGNLLDVYERQDAQFEAAWRCRGRCQSLLWLVRQVHLNINRKMEIFVGCTRQTEGSLILSYLTF